MAFFTKLAHWEHLSALLKRTSLKLVSAKMLAIVVAKQSQPKPFKKAKFRAVSRSAFFNVYLELTFYKPYLHTTYFKQLKKYNFFTNLQSEKRLAQTDKKETKITNLLTGTFTISLLPVVIVIQKDCLCSVVFSFYAVVTLNRDQ